MVHRGGCWVAESGDALVWVPLTVPVARAAWVLDLRLTGTSWSELAIESAGLEPVTPIVASPGGRSRRRWVVTTLPFAAGQLGFRVPSGERLCLLATDPKAVQDIDLLCDSDGHRLVERHAHGTELTFVIERSG